MKKILIASTIACLWILPLTGCNQKESPKPEATQQAQIQAPQPEPPKPLSKQELDTLVTKVMKDNFQAKSGSCWLTKNSWDHTYCLKVKSVNAISHQDGTPETIYILAMGDAADPDEACHAEGGMVAMFVVQPDDHGGYLTIAKKPAFEAGGGWGQGGDGKFISLGKGQYGWKLTSSFLTNGIDETTSVIFGIKDAQVVQLSLSRKEKAIKIM